MAVHLKTALLSSIMLLAPAYSAEAGPLYDWVYGTPTQYTANYRGYAGSNTANYFPRGFSNDIPGSAAADPIYYGGGASATAAQPPAAYAPPALPAQQAPTYTPAPTAAAPGGCNSCQTRNYNYRAPTYRTTTMRVPVTVYRPVTALDPNRGTPVTSYQPCTTYRVQTRRVPSRGWDFPILSWLFGRNRQPVYTQPPVVANYGACGTNPCNSATPSYDNGYTTTVPSAGSTSQPSATQWQPVQQAPTSQPGYVPNNAPNNTQPQQFVPQGTAPSGGVYQPQGNQPQGNQPQGNPAPSGGAAPADRQPRLRPNLDQQRQNQTEEGDTDLNGANGTSLYRAPTRRPYYPQGATPVTGQAKATSKPEEQSAPRVRLRMVPDPDTSNQGPEAFEAPQLINPQDRTARHVPQGRSWGVVPASWPIAQQSKPAVRRPVHQQPATAARPVKSPEDNIHWDDSGWQPARRSW